MTVIGDSTEVPAMPQNAWLLLEAFTTRTEDNAKVYDACLEYVKGCMQEWNEGEAPLSLSEYEGEVTGFFAGHEAAQGK